MQLDRSLTKVRDGIGLGLAISRDLARGMGGEISVSGAGAGRGSRFVVTLPRVPSSAADPLAAATGERCRPSVRQRQPRVGSDNRGRELTTGVITRIIGDVWFARIAG